MTFTTFIDMHSGGGTKIKPYEYIFIELPEYLAIPFFEKKFRRDPSNVTCNCCGDDYSISEHETLAKATEYDRKGWRPTGLEISLEEYILRPDVLVIRKDEIDL